MSDAGDDVMTAAPVTVIRLTTPSEDDGVMRVDRVWKRANAMVAYGTGRGLHEVDNEKVR